MHIYVCIYIEVYPTKFWYATFQFLASRACIIYKYCVYVCIYRDIHICCVDRYTCIVHIQETRERHTRQVCGIQYSNFLLIEPTPSTYIMCIYIFNIYIYIYIVFIRRERDTPDRFCVNNFPIPS